jgi:LPXTG-site transpeptidase (sortase) family protein
MSRLSLVLIACGVCLTVFGVTWQLGVWPGSQTTLPTPVALEPKPTATRPVATSQPVVTALPAAAPRLQTVSTPLPTPRPTEPPTPTPVPIPVVVADAEDRKLQPPEQTAGYAVRLAIPSINLDTQVVQGGIVQDAHGNSIWQTLPFVAVHYGDLTSLIGAPGNAVISGHVVTIDEGNVFRLLYQVGIDDEIQVWDQREREHDYHVVDVRLVPPSDISVIASTPDETLTLITCGGTFDRIRRQFSSRLIVTAKPSQNSELRTQN